MLFLQAGLFLFLRRNSSCNEIFRSMSRFLWRPISNLESVIQIRGSFYSTPMYRIRYSRTMEITGLLCVKYIRGPFHKHWLTLIITWMINQVPNKVWDEIIYPFPNFNCCTAEVWESWTSSNGNIFSVTGPFCGEFTGQRPVTQSFVFFDLRLSKQLSKQCRRWWFETLSWPLWRHCYGEKLSHTP